MTDLQSFLLMLYHGGGTHSETPDFHGGTCVQVGLEGYLTIEFFFDKAGRFTRAAKQKLAT